MARINWIRLSLELIFTLILLLIFPFTIERKIKLFLLYVFSMLIVGRFQKTTLLFYDELRLIFMGYLGFLFTAMLTIGFRVSNVPYEASLIVIFFCVDLLISILVSREAHIIFEKQVVKPTLILGTGKTARKLHNVILANRFSTMHVEAMVNCNDSNYFENVNQEVVDQNVRVIPFRDLDRVIDEAQINTVLIAIPEISSRDLSKITLKLQDKVDHVKFLPYTQEQVNYASSIDDFDGVLMISTSAGKAGVMGRFFKRLVDIGGGLVGSALVIVVTPLIKAFNVYHHDHGPVFFTQKRLGKNGELFTVWKFRTMRLDAEEQLEKLLNENPALAMEYQQTKKLKDDPRITEAGKFLRKTSLDELPQLFNVLKGEMSLIGPRPYLPKEAKDMDGYYESIIKLSPGMTGMWQTHGRSAVSFEQRLQLDDFYYRNWSFWLDITILAKTFQIIFSGDKGAM